MSIQRRSLFGIPPKPVAGSTNTWRAVPLSQGVQLDQPWPLLAPGSTISMSNWLPLDGVLVPRSRLSSINTIAAFLSPTQSAAGIAKLTRADFGTTTLWVSSANTRHALVTSNGSISRASFVSSFGLGAGSLAAQTRWQYAQTYIATLGSGENVLLAVGRSSADTILCLYQTGGSASGAPVYSYLTSAPQCMSIGAWNNYIIAFNTREAGVPLPNRARWPVRGSPSNWTGEGSGFEDLLEMRGSGTAVVPTSDNYVLLFTDLETWYATASDYPRQFLFQALEHEIGCPFPETIQQTDKGVLFVGSDIALRLIPSGGGKSQVVVPGLAKQIRRNMSLNLPPASWAVYDPILKIYHLTMIDIGGTSRGIAVNVQTGEWGYEDYNANGPVHGVAGLWNANAWPANEGLFFVNSSGTVFSTNSLLAQENGSNVTAIWRSSVIAADLAGNWKQLTKVCADHRTTSKSTMTVKHSGDGGNTYESTGAVMSLPVAPGSGRVELDVYRGGAFNTLELTSQSTGLELHRLDVSMNIGGRK